MTGWTISSATTQRTSATRRSRSTSETRPSTFSGWPWKKRIKRFTKKRHIVKSRLKTSLKIFASSEKSESDVLRRSRLRPSRAQLEKWCWTITFDYFCYYQIFLHFLKSVKNLTRNKIQSRWSLRDFTLNFSSCTYLVKLRFRRQKLL